MKIYVLTQTVDHPYGVEVLAVYSSKEKALKKFKETCAIGLDGHKKFEDIVKEYILEFELDLDPEQ